MSSIFPFLPARGGGKRTKKAEGRGVPEAGEADILGKHCYTSDVFGFGARHCNLLYVARQARSSSLE
jgi:hypothetical protein